MSTITDPRWRADIAVGRDGSDWLHSWTYYEDKGATEDATQVLQGLTFGWFISTPYWPAQPDAQGATFAINAPDFADVADLKVGDPVAIKVRLYNAELSVGSDPIEIDGPTVAEFYGRISDLTARPRRDRPGVTLSVTAVDYTVDLTEGLNTKLKSLRPWLYEFYVIQEPALANILWTYLGGTPDTIDDLWTSDNRYANIERTPDAVGPAIEALLTSAFVYDPDGTSTRMIVSPVVTEDGLLQDPGTGRMFTLDTITRPDPDALADMSFDGSWLGRDIEWVQNKDLRPGIGLINVKLGTSADSVIETTIEIVLVDGSPAVSLTSIEASDWITTPPRGEQMARFYLGDPASDDVWQIGSVTLYPQALLDADALDHAAVHQLGQDLYHLFPHWTLAEADPQRAAGYTRRLGIVATPDSVTPYPLEAESISGIVRGAQLTIAGGRLTFDFSLIRMRHNYAPTG